MQFRIPLVVRCIKEFHSPMYPETDFGRLGVEYNVQMVIPNGCYYVLRHLSGEMLGGPENKRQNHLVNMDRFEPIQWMTENGICDESDAGAQ